MNFIGNLLWIICGGLIMSILWFIIGIIYCITIIGIPIGKQAIKISYLSLVPFGKTINQQEQSLIHVLGNLIWIIFGGLELALIHSFIGIVLSITIIGIPFGKQHFKLCVLSFAPFGSKISK